VTAPIAETVEERILANVQTTLAAISPLSVEAEYWTTVKRVFRMDRDPADVATQEVPAIAVIYDASTPYYDFAGVINYDLALQLYLCMAKRSETDWKRDLGRFAADVQRALRLDPRRGVFNDQANAFDTNVSEVRSSNAPPESAVVMARVDVTVQFRHLANDPTAAA